MLASNKGVKRRKRYPLFQGKVLKEVSLFHFPEVKGLEAISQKLKCIKADSVFSALLQAFSLRQIKNAKEAREAEYVLEYIERAFEESTHPEIEQYRQILLLLISEFDDQHYISAAEGLEPAQFLKLLLEDNNLCQKELVPDCFKSESQVSEFLHQRKGRKRLDYWQAIALSARFGVDVLNFLR